MQTLLLSSIEKALNAYLRTDTHSSKRLAKVAGRSVGMELIPFGINFICNFHPDSISVKLDDGEQTCARIKGTPLQLCGMLLDKDRRQQFFADDVTMEGDAELAQQVLHLFEHVHIDWEEHTSKWIGDVPAYQLGQFVKGIRSWLGKSGTSFSQDMNDYLHEEKAWFPQREELQEFFTDVDTIRMDTDRLEARLAHLQSLLNKEEMS